MEDKRLEKARKEYEMYKNANDVFHCEALERIFPELAESEDEKIRKYIIKYFEASKDELSEGFKWNGITVEQCVAYLEKQGEKTSDKIVEKARIETLDEAIKHCEEKGCSNTECAAEHRQLAKWLMELKGYKEQKPTDKIVDKACEWLDRYYDSSRYKPNDYGDYKGKEGFIEDFRKAIKGE